MQTSGRPLTDEWYESGSCRALDDPDTMFPDNRDGEEAAKAVCKTCPSAYDCGLWALMAEERFGVWGGMTEKERRKILRTADRDGVSPSPAATLAEVA